MVSASRAARNRRTVANVIALGQGGGGIPANALISRADNQPILSRSTNETLTARAA